MNNFNTIFYKNREISNNITIRQLQNKALEILIYFQSLCRKNGLRYWVGGGTLIGALRHKGFIPWDDDIDVFMPRNDYERLYQLWPEIADTGHYALCRTNRNKNYHQTDMQLVDTTTTFINRHSQHEDIEHGVSIDIMPFEGCPEGYFARLGQIWHSILYCVYNVQRLPDHQGKLLRWLTNIVLKLIKNPDKRYRIWRKHEKAMTRFAFDNSKNVKETITSFRALFYSYPREYFETRLVPFENIQVPIPVGAHEYLTRIFGDYMQLPPEEKRLAKHDVVFIDLMTPYDHYRGIHYLTDARSTRHDNRT